MLPIPEVEQLIEAAYHPDERVRRIVGEEFGGVRGVGIIASLVQEAREPDRAAAHLRDVLLRVRVETLASEL